MLTPEQIAARKLGIGASEAAKICAGEWHDLWLLKTGRREDDDLSDVFAVQLGIETERLNLLWYTKRTGHFLSRFGESVVHPKYGFIRCTLDGFDPTEKMPVQAKHVVPWTKIDECVERYRFQVMHECLVTGTNRGVLSVIIGTSEPLREIIDLDQFWANEYIASCQEFWGYVERDEPPPQGAPVDAPPIAPDKMRTVSFEGNNAWASAANDWLNHGAAAKLFDKSAKDLKTMVEPDVKEAFGHGIKITRSKVGLSIKRS